MKCKHKVIRQKRRAFTLVELLLVLVILAVLAGIVLPKFAGRGEDAKKTAAASQISMFATALNSFEIDTGSYPKGKSGLNSLMQAPSDAQGWKGPYMEHEVPNDPWGHPYIYEAPGKHNPTSYDLYSAGPNGRTGDEDDITNWKTEKR